MTVADLPSPVRSCQGQYRRCGVAPDLRRFGARKPRMRLRRGPMGDEGTRRGTGYAPRFEVPARQGARPVAVSRWHRSFRGSPNAHTPYHTHPAEPDEDPPRLARECGRPTWPPRRTCCAARTGQSRSQWRRNTQRRHHFEREGWREPHGRRWRRIHERRRYDMQRQHSERAERLIRPVGQRRSRLHDRRLPRCQQRLEREPGRKRFSQLRDRQRWCRGDVHVLDFHHGAIHGD